MSNNTANRDTVVIEDSVHEIYKTLTEGQDLVMSPFRTMKDVFMWAVALGVRMGERRPLSGRRVMIFRWAQFSPQVDVPLLKAVALATGGDVATLVNQEAILTAAEEYANAGIHELRASVLQDPGQPLWNLVAAAQAGREEPEASPSQ